MLGKLIDLLYPPLCLVCHAPLRLDGSVPDNPMRLCTQCDPGTTSPRFLGLAAELPDLSVSPSLPHVFCCERCGEPTSSLPSHLPFCVACQVWPPPLRWVRSLWHYSNAAERVIKALKYGRQRPLAKYLGSRAADAILNSPAIFPETAWDLLLPIPSTKRVLQRRSFSHTALITRSCARFLAVPFSLHALRSSRARLAQASLDREARSHNVANAFAVDATVIAGKRILLIDDMMTTGATLWNAAWCILEAGAISVDALTIARSRQFQSLRLVPTNTNGIESECENQQQLLANSIN